MESEVNNIFKKIKRLYREIYTDYTKYDILINNDVIDIKETFLKILRKNSDLKIPNKKKQKYYIKKVTDNITLKLLLTYAMFYYFDNIQKLKSGPYKNLMIGLDFEFSENKIALCQIGFFPFKRFKYIFILDPKMLSEKKKLLFIQTMFTSSIYKITHGSESLDLPYIYEQLFENNKTYIFDFTKMMIDTRFLCEYFKIFFKSSDRKCSIYDALLHFNVINNTKFIELNKINDSMGPVQDVRWNIKKMSSYHLKYVLYDVLYLKEFVINVFKLSLEKNNSLYQQLKYISQINRFICYEKYDVSEILKETKMLVDPMNNYIVYPKFQENKKTMITIYGEVMEFIILPSIDMKITKLLDINNFKKPLILLFKRIIYGIILEKYQVYENKKDKVHSHIEYTNILKKLIDLKLERFSILIDNFIESVKVNIIKLV